LLRKLRPAPAFAPVLLLLLHVLQIPLGIAVSWGVSKGCEAFLPLPPPLPHVVGRSGSVRVTCVREEGWKTFWLPSAVTARVILFLIGAPPRGAGCGGGGSLLQGTVSWGWWRAFVEAHRVWHGAVVGARWHAVRAVFGSAHTVKVALDAKVELRQLRQMGVRVEGEVLDPQVPLILDVGGGHSRCWALLLRWVRLCTSLQYAHSCCGILCPAFVISQVARWLLCSDDTLPTSLQDLVSMYITQQ
jgi:hypothetical protein